MLFCAANVFHTACADDPKEIFICDVENCTQRFVRADLLARHKKRHSGSYTPRNRIQSFSDPQNTSPPTLPATSFLPQGEAKGRGPDTGLGGAPDNGLADTPGNVGPGSTPGSLTTMTRSRSHPSPSVPRDAAILLTPESSTDQLSGQPLTQNQTHMQARSPPQASLTQAQADWTAGALMSDLTSCDVVCHPKTGTYYPPNTQEEHSPQHVTQLHHHHVPGHSPSIQETAPGLMPFNTVQFVDSSVARDYFTMWLFDNQATYGEFNMGQLPFLEGGLESPFNNAIHYDYEALASRSRGDTPPRQPDIDEAMTENRRQEILREFELFRTRRPRTESRVPDLGGSSGGDGVSIPTLDVMNDCLYAYWEFVSPHVPIIHQPTFLCNFCPPLLLLVMVALGAASLHGRNGAVVTTGSFAELGSFGDSIITSARWEILTADEASPPVALWVAQALLLLEFYEKMYSSRRLHERSHIYHSAVLTLLRRGSPFIGRSGSESPPDEVPIPSAANIRPPSSAAHHTDHQQGDWHAWWTRWAETEAMHRVAFAAFCFDVTHAAMFGHAADMAPHEIRLPLPCDDNLWTAWKPDDVRKYDTDLRMYGVKPIFFLDGLKRALHGQEVQTHSFGRMIIMSGLLSVGWHLNSREKNVTWLDLKMSSEVHENWRTILLKAFDNWKESFDRAQGALGAVQSSDPSILPSISATVARRGCSNGPIQSAAVLYHLAHISLHVDIIDCQVYAGVKRVLGRRVTSRDYTNVVSRMKTWATQPSTRHAILHAFRLLHHVLVQVPESEKNRHCLPGSKHIDLPPIENPTYSCRIESDPHRPWIMYYSTLSIWAFVHTFGDIRTGPAAPYDDIYQPRYTQQMQRCHAQSVQPQPASHPVQPYDKMQIHNQAPPRRLNYVQQYQQQAAHPEQHTGYKGYPFSSQASHITSSISPTNTYHGVAVYLSRIADLPELNEATTFALSDGLPYLLDYLHNILSEARSELLQEAHMRLKKCRDILLGVSGLL